MVEMEALQLREIRWNVTTVQASVNGNILLHHANSTTSIYQGNSMPVHGEYARAAWKCLWHQVLDVEH